MLKVKVRWSGFIGSPGWSNFYFDTGNGDFTTAADAGPCADRVNVFLTAIRAHFPTALQWTIQSDVEAIAASTGELLNIHSAGARSPLSGTAAASAYSGVSGPVVTWRTAGVRNGRRVRGRTFLVPSANNAYQSDGTLEASVITTLSNAANALADQAAPVKLGVWSRPTAPGASDGQFFTITQATVPDMAAVLRSRRG